MALSVPSFPNPASSANPLADAYAWLAGISLDLSRDAGRMVLNVHAHEADWRDRPVGQVAVSLGQVIRPADAEHGVPAVKVATLAELMAEPEFAAAYEAIGARLYRECLKHPSLADATITPAT